MVSGKVKNILIIKPSALGDIALSLPALASIRKSYPDAKIAWLVRSEFAPLLEMTENLDELILFDRGFLGKCWYNPKALIALIKFFRKLRKGRFDLVIDLQGLFRTAFFGWITASKQRFGMKCAREFAGLFYTHRIAKDEDRIHLIDFHNKIISAAGVSDLVIEYGLEINPQADLTVDKLLDANECSQKKYAVLITGAAHDKKCWSVEKFAKLAERLYEQFDLSVIAVGTGAERKRIEELKTVSNVPVVDLAGMTNIPVLTSLLKRAEIVISNDTGPGHIAAAVGSPLVMIFGPTNPARIYPYHKPESVAAIEPFDRGSEVGNPDSKYDIENVSFGLVFQKVSEILGSASSS